MLMSKELFEVDTNLFFDDDLLTFFSTNISTEFKTFLACNKVEQVGLGQLPEKKLNMFACFAMVVSQV